MKPYFSIEGVDLYLGDCREILLQLEIPAGAVAIADPPYGQTALKWDRWPTGWPDEAAKVFHSLWCFGTLRMFMKHAQQFGQWEMSQDVVWEKHNGSSMSADRFRRVHEQVAHFYRGAWAEIYRDPQFTHDATARTVRRKARPPHWGDIGAASYESEDGGPRLMRSVIFSRSCHGSEAGNETAKPFGILAPLIQYSTPHGGTVVDLFAGSGAGLKAARLLGRRAIGIEAREEQCDGIAESMRQGVIA